MTVWRGRPAREGVVAFQTFWTGEFSREAAQECRNARLNLLRFWAVEAVTNVTNARWGAQSHFFGPER
jgi:hypothetical protein